MRTIRSTVKATTTSMRVRPSSACRGRAESREWRRGVTEVPTDRLHRPLPALSIAKPTFSFGFFDAQRSPPRGSPAIGPVRRVAAPRARCRNRASSARVLRPTPTPSPGLMWWPGVRTGPSRGGPRRAVGPQYDLGSPNECWATKLRIISRLTGAIRSSRAMPHKSARPNSVDIPLPPWVWMA